MKKGHLIVTVHDATPPKLSQLEEITQELDSQGIDKRCVSVIPHYQGKYSLKEDKFLAWLHDEMAKGTEVVMHGLEHQPLRKATLFNDPRSWLINLALFYRHQYEFINLSGEETLDRVRRGKERLAEVGVDCSGFIAPCYFVSREGRPVIEGSFDYAIYFDSLVDHRTGRKVKCPTTGLDGDNRPINKFLLAYTRFLFWKADLMGKPLVRIEYHPQDLKDEKAFAKSLELLKKETGKRTLETYKEFLEI